MGTLKDSEDRSDTLNWNRRMRREMVAYSLAEEEGRREDKRNRSINIMELMYEKLCLDYDVDGVLLEHEQINMIRSLEDILTGKKKVSFGSLQADWNKELSEVLEQGDLVRILELAKIGKKLAFIRKPNAEHMEYYNKVREIANKISKSIEKDAR